MTVMKYLHTLLPFWKELKHYQAADFRADLVAALTVTPVAVPQAMAYALMAGVHPQYGIYACMLPVVVAALWGSCRFLAAGPTNATSIVLLSTIGSATVGGVAIAGLPPSYQMTCVFTITLLCGMIQVAMGLARLGDLANFISQSVMQAFATGTALLIASSQIETVLGLPDSHSSGFFLPVWSAIQHIDQINVWCVGIAALSIVLVEVCRRISRRLPATLLALVGAGLFSWLIDASGKGVALVGTIPSVIPPISRLPLDVTVYRDLFMPALALALMGAVTSLSTGKQLAGLKGDRFDGSQELIGQGLGNMAAACTSSIVGCGSFSRSALVVTSGARTRMATVLSGLLALPMLWLIAPFMSWLPLSALGGVLLTVCVRMVDVPGLRLCFKATRIDRTVLLVTFAATLLLALEQAILLGVLLSLILFIFKLAHPRVFRLNRHDPMMQHAPEPLPDEIAVYIIEGTLFFGAINELERRIYAETETPVRVIVLHLARVFWLDAAGTHALEQFVERSHQRHIPVILVVGSRSVHDILKRTGMLSYLGKGFVAPTFADGLKIGFNTYHRLMSDEHLHLPKLPPSKRKQSRHVHHPHQHHKSRNK